jgi:hypothetical protein
VTSVVALVAGVGVSAYLFGSAMRRSWTERVGLALIVVSLVMALFVGAPELPLWLTWLLLPAVLFLGFVVRHERAKRAPSGGNR